MFVTVATAVSFVGEFAGQWDDCSKPLKLLNLKVKSLVPENTELFSAVYFGLERLDSFFVIYE